MFVTTTIFDTDPTEFATSKAAEMKSKFLSLNEQDHTYAGDIVVGLGGGRRLGDLAVNPKLVLRTWHNIDIARIWVNYCKDELFAGSGLTFVSTIEEIVWSDDSHTDFLENPVKLETIRSDS